MLFSGHFSHNLERFATIGFLADFPIKKAVPRELLENSLPISVETESHFYRKNRLDSEEFCPTSLKISVKLMNISYIRLNISISFNE